MNQHIFRFIVLTSLLIVTACGSENVDLSPPSMEVVSFDPASVEDDICGTQEPVVFQLQGGDELSFDVIFNDDNALSQYKVDIHNNFDCHGHGGGGAPSVVIPNVANQTEDWTVLDIQDLTGNSSSVERTLKVPANVTNGNYHFQIQVIDESGNDNPSANIFALKIKNPLDDIAPEITVQEPLNNSFSIEKGTKVRFAGQVTDNYSLSDGGNGVLYLAYTDLSSGNTFTTDQVFVFDENTDTAFDFDFEYTVPQTLVAGSYRFSLGANDGVRNVASFKTFEVEVSN